jgi:hypothetical protein
MGNFELEFLWAGLCVGNGYEGKVESLVFNADRQPTTDNRNSLSFQVSGLRSQVSGLRSQVSGLRSQVSGLRSQVSGLIQTRIRTIKVEQRTNEKTFGQHMGTRLKIW